MPVTQRLREFAQHGEVQAAAGTLALIFLALLALAIFAIWFAAKLFVPESTFRQALKVWIVQVLWSIVWVVAFISVTAVLISVEKAELIAVAWILGLLLWLLSLVVVVGKIYETNFFRALAVFVVSLIFNLLLNFGLDRALSRSTGIAQRFAAVERLAGKTPAERQAFSRRLAGIDSPDKVERALDEVMHPIGKPKTLAEREAAVRSIQAQLEDRRRELQPGDVAGLEQHRTLSRRYLQLLEEVKAERLNRR